MKMRRLHSNRLGNRLKDQEKSEVSEIASGVNNELTYLESMEFLMRFKSIVNTHLKLLQRTILWVNNLSYVAVCFVVLVLMSPGTACFGTGDEHNY